MKLCPTCQHTYEAKNTYCPNDGTALQSSVAPLSGQVLDGQYEIKTLLAQGRTGTIYHARRLLLGDRVVIKIFKPELARAADWLGRFQRAAAQAARRFRHPNAVIVYDMRAHPDGLTYVVMEYADGHTLDKELQQRVRLPANETLEVLTQIAQALDACHSAGMSYNPLKPTDMLLTRPPAGRPLVKLLPPDFEHLAASAERAATATLAGVSIQLTGLPYMAPELWRGETPDEQDGGADIYSLAALCYELLSGRKAFTGQTLNELAVQHLTGQPQSLATLVNDVLPAVGLTVNRALAKDRAARPATAVSFVEELRRSLGPGPPASASTLEEPPAPAQAPAGELASALVVEAAAPLQSPDNSPPPNLESAERPLYADENVQFTVYQPEALAPARWYTLLAFAHLAQRRPDAPPDEPEPLAEVQRLAARVLAEQPAAYDAVKQHSLHAVPHKSEITFVPLLEGCEFNPPSQSFLWQKSVHKVEFELRAAAALDGQMARGRLTVFLGSRILADVPLAIRVDSASSPAPRQPPTVPVSAEPYRKIFPSYSHKDRAVVEQIEQHVHALGDKYLRDVTELRAGQDWQRWMRDAIYEADVFQLFWSHNSMRSEYVRQEWEYALSLGRPHFVRPTYWETPLPESRADNLPPAELRQLHFQQLRPSSSTHPSARTTGALLPPPVVAPSPAAVASPAAQTGASCARCGALNRVEATFCRRCGGALRRQAAAQTWTPPQIGAPPLPYASPASGIMAAPTLESMMPGAAGAVAYPQDAPTAPLAMPMSRPPSTKSANLFALLVLLGLLLLAGLVLIIYFSTR